MSAELLPGGGPGASRPDAGRGKRTLGAHAVEIPPRLFPFRSHRVELPDGSQVHYVDEGEGTPILLLHGNPTWSLVYRGIIPRLAPYFRCIAPDYPGFGLSQAPDGYGFTPRELSATIEAFVDALGLRNCLVMVQDWGGPIGLGLAGRKPELFSGFVIGNSWAWPVRGQLKYELFSRLVGGTFGQYMVRRFNAYVRWRLPLMSWRGIPSDVLELYRAPFAGMEARRLTSFLPRQILEAQDYLEEVREGLERLRERPALIVWGMSDISFRPADCRQFEAFFPNHQTVQLRRASHLIQEDAPGEISDAIVDWWQRTEAGPLPSGLTHMSDRSTR